jgi:CBS domain-containing protein
MSMSAFLEGKAGEYMTRKVTTVTRDMTLDELEALFEALDFNSFPVVEDGRIVGIVTKFDFLKAFAFTTSQMVPRYEELMLGTVGETMTETVVDVQPDVPLTRVLQLMVNFRARSFPVTDGAGMLVGMISREDLMRALRDAVPPPV